MADFTFYSSFSRFESRRRPQQKACCTSMESLKAPSTPFSNPSGSASFPTFDLQCPQLSLEPSTLSSLAPRPSPPRPLRASDFLWLPADIVLYLFKEHLPPATATALSLTCKTLFRFVFPTVAPSLRKNPSELQDLQLLLEKDHGQDWWYCDGCSTLHRTRSQGPTIEIPTFSIKHRSRIIWNPGRLHHNSHWLEGTNFVLDYETVRLVMNRHFFGPPNGLPLECFSVEVKSILWQPWQQRLLPWRETWSARIIQDELFLSATRTLSSAGWTDEEFRSALNKELRQVCGHVRAASRFPFTVVNALRPQSSAPAGSFAPCRAVTESCGRCLTDYTTTVERRREAAEQTAESWAIAITSYHQLGSGRSATDAKFEAFGRRTSKAAGIITRDMVAYPPGAVKAAWDLYTP